MKKILLSNLCTFVLTVGVSFFIFTSILEEERKTIINRYNFKKIKMSAARKKERNPSSISPHIQRIAKARAEEVSLRQQLKYDPKNWKDTFLMHYQGTKKVNGEIVSLSDLYRPFFMELLQTLKKYHGKDASKRVSELLAAKDRYDKAKDDLYDTRPAFELRQEMIDLVLSKKIKKFRREISQDEEISEAEAENIIQRFSEKQRINLETKYDKEEYRKIEKVDKVYEYEKKKILGPAYVEFERLKEHYNEQYHKAYGNGYYMADGEWDEESKEWVKFAEPVERESDSPMFSLDI